VSFDLLFYSLLILFHQETEVIFARLLSTRTAQWDHIAQWLDEPARSRGVCEFFATDCCAGLAGNGSDE
jgi:hypothetical protein